MLSISCCLSFCLCQNKSYSVSVYAYVEDYHTCSVIFKEPVNAGMDNTTPCTRILKG